MLFSPWTVAEGRASALTEHLSRYALDLGVSARSQVLRLSKTENGVKAVEALISSGAGRIHPTLSLISPDILGRDWWGFYLESGAFWYFLDQQQDMGTVVVQGQSLGTAMRGWGAYIDPTLHLSLGRHSAYERRGLALRAGLGYGLGILHVDGDLRWRELPGQPVESYLVTQVNQSVNLFLEFRVGALRARLSTAAPTATAGNGAQLVFSDSSFDLAWTFSLAGLNQSRTGPRDGPTGP